ncbi:MAG TPA: response regulator [Phycisphaerae bacterium]|nr:response regulator [Phycisphaerae bacterium]
MTDMLRPRIAAKASTTESVRKKGSSAKASAPARKRGKGSNGQGDKDGSERAGVMDAAPVAAEVVAKGETLDRRELLMALTALTKGDFTVRLPMGLEGLDGKIAEAFNSVVELNQRLSQEFERLSRVVSREGRISERASIGTVQGSWSAKITALNALISDLVYPTSETARVIGAVAKGDLSQTVALEIEGRPLQGEFLRTAKTVNTMVEQLSSFASEVTRVAREVGTEGKLGGQAKVPGASGTWKDLTDNVNQLAANLTTQVRAIADVATAVTRGDLTRSITVAAQGEVAALKDNINEMIRNLKDTTEKNAEQDWLKTNLAKFSRMLQGQKDLLTVGRLILSELAPVVSAQMGVFYMMDNTKPDECFLKLLASYAYKESKNIDSKFRLGEGLIGQCALEKEKILLSNVPEDYIKITSGLGEATPVSIIVMPVLFEGAVKAVIELASFEHFSATHQAFLDQLTESIGIVLNTIEANMRTENLLKQSQSLARELQFQQEELQQTNQQLAEKAQLLADQNVEVERKNREVEQARQALEEKAKLLSLTSKYKSEFLANMSHELRTPLNSLLILSDQLSKNPEQNLTSRQVEFARTIHSSGNDLLNLINDILDLSKIESGTVEVDVGELVMRDLQEYVDRTFRHVAENKKLDFKIDLAPTLPQVIHTDAKRLQQIIKNLLSNAFKFTEKGKVSLRIDVVERGWNGNTDALNRAKQVLAISVTDTGIGISPDKQQIIFEAFQQADGSTSRKYGGTGLGLSISRELARLLGGEIRLSSRPGAGSTFTLYIPASHVTARVAIRRSVGEGTPPMTPSATSQEQLIRTETATALTQVEGESAAANSNQPSDDISNLVSGKRLLLIVEHDIHFARFLRDTAYEHGFTAAIATRGAVAIAMAPELKPAAITLDVNLPDIDGWHVLNRLKDEASTRHIPVQIITTAEEYLRGLRMGAIGSLTKPIKTKEALDETFSKIRSAIERTTRRVMIVHSDEKQRTNLAESIGGPDVEIITHGGGRDALALLQSEPCDLVVLDMDLQDPKTFDLVDGIKEEQGRHELPVIIHSGRPLTKEEEVYLNRLTQSSVVKDVRSGERLLDEVSLFLHRPLDRMPATLRERIDHLHTTTALLAGRKVLIVDDDIRNIFAMTSILESHHMEILSAETGETGIEMLQRFPDVDIVLMDIMMPDMDGYDTIRAIRKITKFRSLPIVTLTAKAMKGDREKCIEAGASDYLSKPVDTAQLLATLRVWLYR